MKTTIVKQFRIHAAHSLPHTTGKCQRLHGHNYLIKVAVSGDLRQEGEQAGMVLDFDYVKEWVTKPLDALLDHEHLNTLTREAIHGKTTKAVCDAFIEMVRLPTAEMMAAFVFLFADGALTTGEREVFNTHCAWVEVWETDDSYARVEA